MELALCWVPRDQNSAADALTNSDYALFDAERRIPVDLQHLEWKVLPDVLAAAERLYVEVQQRKLRAQNGGGSGQAKRRMPADRLRAREPW